MSVVERQMGRLDRQFGVLAAWYSIAKLIKATPLNRRKRTWQFSSWSYSRGPFTPMFSNDKLTCALPLTPWSLSRVTEGGVKLLQPKRTPAAAGVPEQAQRLDRDMLRNVAIPKTLLEGAMMKTQLKLETPILEHT